MEIYQTFFYYFLFNLQICATNREPADKPDKTSLFLPASWRSRLPRWNKTKQLSCTKTKQFYYTKTKQLYYTKTKTTLLYKQLYCTKTIINLKKNTLAEIDACDTIHRCLMVIWLRWSIGTDAWCHKQWLWKVIVSVLFNDKQPPRPLIVYPLRPTFVHERFLCVFSSESSYDYENNIFHIFLKIIFDKNIFFNYFFPTILNIFFLQEFKFLYFSLECYEIYKLRNFVDSLEIGSFFIWTY